MSAERCPRYFLAILFIPMDLPPCMHVCMCMHVCACVCMPVHVCMCANEILKNFALEAFS